MTFTLAADGCQRRARLLLLSFEIDYLFRSVAGRPNVLDSIQFLIRDTDGQRPPLNGNWNAIACSARLSLSLYAVKVCGFHLDDFCGLRFP